MSRRTGCDYEDGEGKGVGEIVVDKHVGRCVGGLLGEQMDVSRDEAGWWWWR